MDEELFVSYAPEDRKQVMDLVERLRQAEVSVWADPGDTPDPILRGAQVVEAINACKVAAVVVSPAAAESRDVLKEAFLASEAGKPVLPLHLEPSEAPAALRYQLAGIRPIELFDGDPDVKLRVVLHALRALGVGAQTPQTAQSPAGATQLEETLASLGFEGTVTQCLEGPTITRYEIRPAKGQSTRKLARLTDDIALALAAADVRLEPPPPGKSTFALEVPNEERTEVQLADLLHSEAFQQAESPLTVPLGVDVAGAPVVADLGRMPHLLIGGAGNSGKTTLLHSMIAGLSERTNADQVRFILIDPKRVEFKPFEGIPSLMAPIVHTAPEAADVLRQTIAEMERRYQLLAGANCRNIVEYNQAAGLHGLPYIVVMIDELADLMMAARAETEFSICRLAQLARATGIHLVIATQRPSVNVVTGTIKANMPSRIAFAVCSVHDSRVILDTPGAERLVGRGDMLFQPIDRPRPLRVQGALVTVDEVHRLADALRSQGPPAYAIVPERSEAATALVDGDLHDELYEAAVRLVTHEGEASVSRLQRQFKIGYARAGRLMDMLEENGIVGPAQGSKPRDVLVDPEG